MTFSNRNLSRQVALFLLVVSCLSAAVMTLLVAFLPNSAVSQVWRLSPGGAVGIGLASLSLGAIMLGDRLGRIVLPALLAAFGLLCLAYRLYQPAGEQVPPGEAFVVPLAPALFFFADGGLLLAGVRENLEAEVVAVQRLPGHRLWHGGIAVVLRPLERRPGGLPGHAGGRGGRAGAGERVTADQYRSQQ